MSHQIIHPDGWAPAKGYANGVVAEGKTLWIGGQIGWDADKRIVSDSFVGQMEQALQNIADILGGSSVLYLEKRATESRLKQTNHRPPAHPPRRRRQGR